MGTKPVYALAGLFVVGSLLSSGCRNGPSGGGFDRGGPQMIGQSGNYTSSTTVAGRTPAGSASLSTSTTLSKQPMTPGESTVIAQPMPNATTYPNVTTPSVGAAAANQYGGGNAFSSSPPALQPPPPSASYQMQSQSMQMQTPGVQATETSTTTTTAPAFGTQGAPRGFGTTPATQGYRTDRFQQLAPGGDQQQQ